MADETVNEESENNLVQLYKSKFDYCSEFFLLKKAFKTKDKNGTETIKFKLICQKCPRIAIGKLFPKNGNIPENPARAFNTSTSSSKQPRFQFSGEFANVIQ